MSRESRLQFGPHLDAYGEQCRCTQPRSKPAAQPRPAQPKKRSIPLWDAQERAAARRAGYPVWIKSESERQV